MWKQILIGILVAGVLGLGWMAWQQHLRIQEAREEAARLEVERDLALAQADSAQAEADSIAREAARLDSLRLAEKERVERRNRALNRQADSLTTAIGELMPPELVDIEIAEAVQDAVMDLNMAHEEEVTNLTNLLSMTEVTLERIRTQSERQAQVNASLRRALAIETERADTWERAASPDFLGRLKGNSGLLTGAAAVGVFLTLVAGG